MSARIAELERENHEIGVLRDNQAQTIRDLRARVAELEQERDRALADHLKYERHWYAAIDRAEKAERGRDEARAALAADASRALLERATADRERADRAVEAAAGLRLALSLLRDDEDRYIAGGRWSDEGRSLIDAALVTDAHLIDASRGRSDG